MPTLRDELEALKAEIDRGFADDLGWFPQDFLGHTKTVGSYPTAANVFYAVSPVTIAGEEAEGEAAMTIADDSQTFFVYNAGPDVPPIGSKVVVKRVPDRWVMYYHG